MKSTSQEKSMNDQVCDHVTHERVRQHVHSMTAFVLSAAMLDGGIYHRLPVGTHDGAPSAMFKYYDWFVHT